VSEERILRLVDHGNRGCVRERASARVIWRVLRLDDNDNRFVVAECACEDEARRIADEFSARGHKQAYWAECGGEDEEGDGR
jgi:hypothetical protein